MYAVRHALTQTNWFYWRTHPIVSFFQKRGIIFYSIQTIKSFFGFFSAFRWSPKQTIHINTLHALIIARLVRFVYFFKNFAIRSLIHFLPSHFRLFILGVILSRSHIIFIRWCQTGNDRLCVELKLPIPTSGSFNCFTHNRFISVYSINSLHTMNAVIAWRAHTHALRIAHIYSRSVTHSAPVVVQTERKPHIMSNNNGFLTYKHTSHRNVHMFAAHWQSPFWRYILLATTFKSYLLIAVDLWMSNCAMNCSCNAPSKVYGIN